MLAASAKASASNAWLEALFFSSREAMLLCAGDGTIVEANEAAQGVLERGGQQVGGHSVTRWLTQPASEAPTPFPLRDGEATVLGAGDPAPVVDIRVTRVETRGEALWLLRIQDSLGRPSARDQLARLASYDHLTGLPNRGLFRDRLSQAMTRAQRSGRPMALMFLDLDRFKTVNDGLGHEVGDRLLVQVSQLLIRCLRGADSVGRNPGDDAFTLSRLGGDEFTVIVEAIGTAEDAAYVAQRLLEAMSTPFVVGDEEIVISCSIGISMYPTDDVDLDGLIRHTDMAMYRAKSLGRNTFSFFSDDLNADMAARMSLEGSLRHAVERQEFQLYYQPKADLRSGNIVGVEALLRWNRPGHGVVTPDRFVSVLEDTALILPVGAWVIRAACAQLAEWDRVGMPRLHLAVNLSARQFRHQFLASLVQDTLRELDIDPQRLEIELTESLLMEDTEANRAVLESFRALGVRLAIDDFGTGHSSLSYLKRFSVDALKIDRSFVQSLPDSSEDMAITAAVIAMGRTMKIRIVAEGVETEAQAQALRELGCEEIQGYLLGPPMTGPDFAEWLAKRLTEGDLHRGGFGYVRDTSPDTLFTLLADV